MSNYTLDDVVATNNQLAALSEIGIPANLGSRAKLSTIPKTLDQINSSLSLRTSLGQSLLCATSENQDLPPIYRSALESGLRSNHLAATLDGISQQAKAESELRSTFGRSLVSPLIVLALGYLGFIFLCLYYSPTIEGMYLQVDQPLSRPVEFLATMRNWLPYWATLLPLLIIGAMIYWQRGWKGCQHFIPGKQRYSSEIRNANFAHQLRMLLKNNVPLADSILIAAQITNDAKLISASEALSISYGKNEKILADDEVLQAIPPLLRWMLAGDIGNQSLLQMLHFAESTYLYQAKRQAAWWRYLLPTLIGALLSGLVVLAYGMSVFVPFVQLLKDISA